MHDVTAHTYDITEDWERLSRWCALPHVRSWWGGEDRASGDSADATALYVTDEQGLPFAHAWLRPSKYLPDAVQVDFFIGETSHLGKLYGSRILSAVVDWAREQGQTRFTIDPELDNAKARECYAKAGFRDARVHNGRMVMVRMDDAAY